MLAKIHPAAEMRDARVRAPINVMFWLAPISGVVFAAMVCHTYALARHNLLLLGAFTGIALFSICPSLEPDAPPGHVRDAAGAGVRVRLTARDRPRLAAARSG